LGTVALIPPVNVTATMRSDSARAPPIEASRQLTAKRDAIAAETNGERVSIKGYPKTGPERALIGAYT
jgi:hypothetical protein